MALCMQGQAEPAHAGTEPAGDADRQWGDDGLALGRHPAFPLVAHDLRGQDQIPLHHRLVAFEARAGGSLDPQRHLAGDPIPFGAAAGAPAWTRGLWLGGFVHAGRLERRARRQVLEPGNLVLQGLVIDPQVAVVEAQLLDLLLQSIDLAGQIRDEQAQGLFGQGLSGIRRRRRHSSVESQIGGTSRFLRQATVSRTKREHVEQRVGLVLRLSENERFRTGAKRPVPQLSLTGL